MKKIFSLTGLLLASLFVSCVQPASASQSKHETIKKAVLYQSLIVQQESNYILLSMCTAHIKDMFQLPLNSRNLCVFDLPDRPAKSFRDDRTVIKINHQHLYLRLKKVLSGFKTVTVLRSIPLLC